LPTELSKIIGKFRLNLLKAIVNPWAGQENCLVNQAFPTKCGKGRTERRGAQKGLQMEGVLALMPAGRVVPV
jgi:hypothetical protein